MTAFPLATEPGRDNRARRRECDHAAVAAVVWIFSNYSRNPGPREQEVRRAQPRKVMGYPDRGRPLSDNAIAAPTNARDGVRPRASPAGELFLKSSQLPDISIAGVVRRRAYSQPIPSAPRHQRLDLCGNDRYDPFCDLERRKIVTLLPDREIATFKAWLADHPEIVIVARNRVERMGKCVGHSDQGNRAPHGHRLGGPSKCPITFGGIPLAEKSPA